MLGILSWAGDILQCHPLGIHCQAFTTCPDKCESKTIHSSESSETGLRNRKTYNNNNNNNVYNDLHKIPKDIASPRQQVIILIRHLSNDIRMENPGAAWSVKALVTDSTKHSISRWISTEQVGKTHSYLGSAAGRVQSHVWTHTKQLIFLGQ